MPTSSQKSATVNYTYKPNTGIVTGVSSTVTGIDGTQKTISNTYNYTGDRLTSITHNGFNYSFTYDNFGNRLSTKVGSQTLMTDTYGANNGLLTKSTYGNGNYVENIYDRYDRVTGIKYNGEQKFGYEYNADGLVSRHTDNINGKTYNYTYDLLGRLQKTEISDGNSIGYKFDNVNNVTNTLYKFNGVTKSTTYNHFKGGVVCDVTYPNGATKTRKLNAHAQVRPSYLTTPAGKTWSINRQYYTPTIGGTTYTTNVMGNLIYESIDRTFSYAYNGSGNISKITDKVGTTAKESTFVYDEANQLIRENNSYTNKTVTYTYDAGGNILTKTEYPFTTGSLDGLTGTVVNYTYGNTNWKDLLTEFNGNQITYDQIGNPLSYYNGTQFTWERGRKLATATTADGTAISYKYNDSGIRTQKTVNGVATDYFLDGSKIIAEKTGNNTTWYYYDGDGTREAIEYNGNVYYYFYNAQGDVMGLYDNNLNVVVNYAYDSWGNVVSITGSLASTLGQDNPFRYRGYYFDSDTGLYYLNSRYYDANTGRFINADSLVQTGQGVLDKNMFAYCMNNPVMFIDPTGKSIGLALLGLALLGGSMLFLSGCSATKKSNPAPLPYKSADDAAKAFSEQVYSSSAYIRHEYSTEIYSRTVNGETTYNYNSPRAGQPHSASVGASTPKGTKTVAYAHTHPNSNVFSSADIQVAQNMGIDAYVVGPNLELQRYSVSSATTTNLGVISPIALTDEQRTSLVEEFQVSWDNHVEAGCNFGCNNMTWPTP